MPYFKGQWDLARPLMESCLLQVNERIQLMDGFHAGEIHFTLVKCWFNTGCWSSSACCFHAG